MPAFYRISLALLLLGLLGPRWTPGGPLPAAAVEAIVVDAVAAQPDFPTEVLFTLGAHTTGSKITRAVLSYRFTGDPFTEDLPAAITPAARLTAEARLDTQVNYIPPGVDLTYYWQLEDAAGHHLATPPHQVRYEDKREAWQVREDHTHHIRVHWYRGDTAFGDTLRDTAVQALDNLQAELGLTLTLPVEVWIYPDADSLAEALPPNLPEWIGGKAFVENGVVLGLIDPDDDPAHETRRIVPHELSHLVVYQATRNPYNTPPAWLDEGLAINNQEVQDPDLEEHLQDAAESNALLGLRTLEGSFPADPDAAHLSYAESASAVHFLLERHGSSKVGAVLAAFRGGVTYDEALRAGLGLDTDGIDTAWRESLPYQPRLEPPTATALPTARPVQDTPPVTSTATAPPGGPSTATPHPGAVVVVLPTPIVVVRTAPSLGDVLQAWPLIAGAGCLVLLIGGLGTAVFLRGRAARDIAR